jgi:DNA repair protein SbcC/Rad50
LILKQIVLQNFRSYGPAPTTIELGRGITLFEGDIGSGKSTILYAIEFSLFGLGELEAKYMLRANSDHARVGLEFEVNGQDYTVVRAIDRKKGLRTTTIQTQGWIREPGDSTLKELSPTELRSRILHILSFREKQSIRASSRIFRYAIFTPQELMKDVLMQRPDDRLETLRRAFGIEDYSFAADNTESVISQIDTKVRFYEESAKSLPEREKELLQVKQEAEKDRGNLAKEQEILHSLEVDLNEARARLVVLEGETNRIIQLQSLVPALETSLGELRRELASVTSDLDRNRKTLSEIQMAERKITSLKVQYDNYLLLKARLRELDGIYQEQQKLSEEISKLSRASAAKETRLETEISSLDAQITELEKKLESSEKEISDLQKLESVLENLKEQIQGLSGVQSKAEEISSRTGSTKALLSMKGNELERARGKLGTLDGLTKESNCPLCGQPLNADHISLVAKQFQSEINSLGKEIEQYRSALSELIDESNVINKSKNEYQKLQADLLTMEKKLAQTKEIVKQQEHLKSRHDELTVQKEKLSSELSSDTFAQEERVQLSSMIKKREDFVQRLEDYESSQKKVREIEDLGIVRSYQSAELIVSRKPEVSELIRVKEKRFAELSQQITSKALEIQEKKKELEEGEPLIFEQRKLKDHLDVLQREYPSLKGEVEKLEERLTQETAKIGELDSHVATLRASIAKANDLKAVSAWLSATFLPAVSDIERYVLASINEEFKEIFQRIFSKLVEESDLRVEVDDRFTPIVEQSGYELDVNSLSGGERTAVALAYRLALNYMVKRANEAMQQANLLILDEPTEGFSPEQIYRFKNALEELDCDQVIIVSHARDLEPISDRFYRVEKVNGESVLTTIT